MVRSKRGNAIFREQKRVWAPVIQKVAQTRTYIPAKKPYMAMRYAWLSQASVKDLHPPPPINDRPKMVLDPRPVLEGGGLEPAKSFLQRTLKKTGHSEGKGVKGVGGDPFPLTQNQPSLLGNRPVQTIKTRHEVINQSSKNLRRADVCTG